MLDPSSLTLSDFEEIVSKGATPRHTRSSIHLDGSQIPLVLRYFLLAQNTQDERVFSTEPYRSAGMTKFLQELAVKFCHKGVTLREHPALG